MGNLPSALKVAGELPAATQPKKPHLAVAGLLLLYESFLQIPSGFIQRALGVVVGLQGLTILVGSALALSGDVKDFAQLDVAPDLSPARFAIAVQALAIRIGRGLVVTLQEEHFGDAIVRQRTVLVDVE